MIYRATFQTKSKQLGSALSKELHKKYGKRSVRVNRRRQCDNPKRGVQRSRWQGFQKYLHKKSSVAIEGVKKRKKQKEINLMFTFTHQIF